MTFTVTFIGAGSIGFTRRLIADLLTVPEFNGIRLNLQDISKRNLHMIAQLVERDLVANNSKSTVHCYTDQREAVSGSRYVFNTARVGGIKAFADDINIPLSYGIDQCVGDTLCAGGIFYGQRGIPMMLSLCEDIKACAEPDCQLFNYANPMAMMTWAARAYGAVDATGLCHGVQGGHHLIAQALGVAKDDVSIVCAGINHQTWYTDVRYQGKDMTSSLLAAMEQHPRISQQEKVRIDMLRRFGYFSTESNGHLSEYVPWYRKRSDEISQWICLDDWIHDETGGYLRVCTEGRNWFKADFPNWLKEDPKIYQESERSEEHGSYIIEGLETGRVYRGHFNRTNNGLIPNLPADAVIEGPGFVDSSGLQMTQVPDLPLGCAAVCNQSIAVQRLAVEAAVHGDDDLLRQAMMLDPLVGAMCNPPEIWLMVDDMLIAQARWLPQFKKSVAAAKRRQRKGHRLPTKTDYQGAARIEVASISDMEEQAEASRANAQAADKGKMTLNA